MKTPGQEPAKEPVPDRRPNIVVIMADDMGYSDLGCYGGEIPTPNIDALAENGVRFTRFYNTGRSCPSRAALMTGLYAHQAGIGEMSEEVLNRDPEPYDDGYMQYLNRHCATIGEVLQTAGYQTFMSGKWHLGMSTSDKWPRQRGFDRYYGFLAGATSYMAPARNRGLWLDNVHLDIPQQPYYTTNAFTDYALEFLSERTPDKPFFLYLAYNAPHWPLQAPEEDIAKFNGKYDCGWQEIIKARHARMLEMGLIDESWDTTEWDSRQWTELTAEQKHISSKKMEVYAAQVHCMDRNIGRVLDYLKQEGLSDNTIVIFLSDNGACAENYSELGYGTLEDINKPMNYRNPSYGKPWAQVCNTPYRKFKVRAYEGGVATPFIISWPKKYAAYNGQFRNNVSYITDIMATCIDVSGARYPRRSSDGTEIYPLEGVSLCGAVRNPSKRLHDYIYGEHFNNRFVMHGDWKAVFDQNYKKWELYNLATDRTEAHDVAAWNPEILEHLIAKWEEWAWSHNVYPKRNN